MSSNSDNDQNNLELGFFTGIGNFWLQTYRSFVVNRNTFTTFINRHAEECPRYIEKVCRPSELPIYAKKSSDCTCGFVEQRSSKNSTFVDLVTYMGSKVHTIFPIITEDRQNTIRKLCQNTKEDFHRCKNFIRHSANENERIGLVALGTVAGLLIGFCGSGRLRRVVYPLTGGGTAFYFVYPDEFDHYYDIAYNHVDRGLKICYNFISGPKHVPQNAATSQSDLVKIAKHKCSDPEDQCICRKLK